MKVLYAEDFVRYVCHLADEVPTVYLFGGMGDFVTPELIEEKFGSEVDLIIDGGIGDTEPSTIVNCMEGEAEIVRQGKGWLEE